MKYEQLPLAVQDDIAAIIIEKFPILSKRGWDAADLRAALTDEYPSIEVPVRRIPLSTLSRTYRRKPNALTVSRLASLLTNSVDDLDPIIVSGDTFIDGGHRFAAYKSIARPDIPCADISALLSRNWDEHTRDMVERINRLL